MNNRYIQAQCQNMLAVITAFSQACELTAREDDGEISKAEARSLWSIHAASCANAFGSAAASSSFSQPSVTGRLAGNWLCPAVLPSRAAFRMPGMNHPTAITLR